MKAFKPTQQNVNAVMAAKEHLESLRTTKTAYETRLPELRGEIETAQQAVATAKAAHENAVKDHAMNPNPKEIGQARQTVITAQTMVEDLQESLRILTDAIDECDSNLHAATQDHQTAERLALADVRDQMIAEIRNQCGDMVLQAWGAHRMAGGYHTDNPSEWLRESVFNLPVRVDGFDHEALIYPETRKQKKAA